MNVSHLTKMGIMPVYGKKIFQVTGYIVWGSNSTILLFPTIFKGGSLLKEETKSLQSKIFLLKVDPPHLPFFVLAFMFREANQSLLERYLNILLSS